MRHLAKPMIALCESLGMNIYTVENARDIDDLMSISTQEDIKHRILKDYDIFVSIGFEGQGSWWWEVILAKEVEIPPYGTYPYHTLRESQVNNVSYDESLEAGLLWALEYLVKEKS